MTTLLSLPTEILHSICLSLNLFDREAIARTFNKQLYGVARSTLRTRDLQWLKNTKWALRFFKDSIMAEKWGIPSFPGHIPADSYAVGTHELDNKIEPMLAERLCLPTKRKPLFRTSPPDLCSWVKLDGSLDWLVPLNDKLATVMANYNGREGARPMATGRQVEQLLLQVEKLGLALPAGFLKFIKSDRLHLRIPSFSAWRFALSEIVRCPSLVDGGAGGYLLRFYCDQQHCAFAYLYLHRCGANAVIATLPDAPMFDFDFEPLSKNDFYFEKSYQRFLRTKEVSFENQKSVESRSGKYDGEHDVEDDDDDDDEDEDDEEDEEDNEGDEDEDDAGEDTANQQSRNSIEKRRYFKEVKEAIFDEQITKKEVDLATLEGLQLALGFDLETTYFQGLSFEEYLFTVYHEEQLNFVASGYCDPVANLSEYVAHVYKSELEIGDLSQYSEVQSVQDFLRAKRPGDDESLSNTRLVDNGNEGSTSTDYYDSDLDSDPISNDEEDTQD